MQLTISQLCQQRFDEMTSSSGGRYCQSCQKNVIDFTSFSNAELIDFFQKNNSGVCGRVTQHQLQDNLQPIPSKRHKTLIAKYIIGFGLSIFVPAKKTLAAISDTIPVQLPAFRPALAELLPLISTISGKIIDPAGNPVVGAAVMLRSTTLATLSNSKGEFVLNVPDSLQKTFYSIEISSISFVTQTRSISPPDNSVLVKLEYFPDALLGEVVFVGGICVKKTRWQKVKDWFRFR